MKRLLAVALSIALLAWLASNGHWRALADSFVHLPVSVLALAGLGFAASYLLRALRVFDEFR
ncbi:MAG: UPF0104 family protein, partial [Proteobacteria bacterium]|nr:UPF0104 family protein [Pseudomonadota bacterium]